MTTGKKMVRATEQLPEKTAARRTVSPAVDVYENDLEILLVADVPGADKSRIQVLFDRDRLTIEAPRADVSTGTLLAGEYGVADYSRTFVVPQAIDADGIKAELDRGVLTVHLPKPATTRPRQIAVTSG